MLEGKCKGVLDIEGEEQSGFPHWGCWATRQSLQSPPPHSERTGTAGTKEKDGPDKGTELGNLRTQCFYIFNTT